MTVKAESEEIGIVGLGLMGASIVTALLISGNRVVGVAPLASDLENGPSKIRHYLEIAQHHGLTDFSPEENLARLTLTEDYALLRGCQLVMECVVENIEVKKQVYAKVEDHISTDAILTTNTSAIPNTVLKDFVKYPRRFMGMHWAEPAFTTKFLEIVCNPETDTTLAEKLYAMATGWGKEPILVRKDIRGFITNRIMYAMYREAFNLVENGYATTEDVDRACRNDGGHWMTFCGLFRYMDLTGLQAYYAVMNDLFPTLSNQTEVPQLIENIVQQGGNGITNGKGFYDYTPEEAKEWEKAYEEFAFDISKLSTKYPIDLIEKRLSKKEISESLTVKKT
ncbi:3-hydroxyacyl-CoA dehydrogenase family protein [Persicitalea sp.]|uniref:3-hydroxyacyl-CoA dehydrogenase family protein n=1 Tax=Persicitalea sp. TaxID=3100273 RepID=UPI0035936DDB